MILKSTNNDQKLELQYEIEEKKRLRKNILEEAQAPTFP